jgi:hypothetical protein
VSLQLTAAGRALLAGAPETAQSRLITALERMSPGRRAALVDGLATLVGALGMAAAPPAMFLERTEETGWKRRKKG